MPLALLAFLAASLALAGALYLREFRQELQEQVARELSTIADIKVAQLVAWRKQHIREWEDVEENDFTAVAIESVLGGARPPELVTRLRQALWTVAHRQGAIGLELVSADGVVLIAAPGPSTFEEQDMELLERAHHAGQPLFSGAERANPRLSLAVPLAQGVAGALIHFDTDQSLTSMVTEWPHPGTSSEPALVRREGDRVVTMTRLRHSPVRAEMQLDGREPGPRAVRGETGVVVTTDYRGRDSIAALRHVPDSDWYLSNKVDRAEVFATVRTRGLQVASGIGLILALCAGMLLFWWRGLLAEDRRRAGAAAQESLRRRFEALWAQAHDIVLVAEMDGVIAEANDRAVEAYGYSRDELVGKHVTALRAPDQAVQWAEDWGRVHREGAVRYETVHRRRDGSTFPVELSSRSFGAAGEGLVLAVGRDITARKAAEAERRKLEAQLTFADRLASIGTLAAGVAHEINNPLSYLLANLEYLQKQLPPWGPGLASDATAREVLEEARDGARRIGEIVRGLRTFSRREGASGGGADLREAAQAAVRMAQGAARPRARLEVALEETPPVAGAEHELAQVVLNLVINAVQAIPEGRPSQNHVRVATRTVPGGRVELTVSDTGAGIPAENLQRIFDPFFTTKEVGEGSGLGLAICHGLVEALGGSIGVQSAPGRGSTFTVSLPAVSRAAAATPTRSAPEARPRGRVLVVDDEPFVCRSVQRTLQGEHEVLALTDPREALSRISGGERFDLVILDLVMPGLSGMEAYEELCRLRPDLAGRVLFLTGGAFTPNSRRFLDENPGRWMEKPFEPAGLRARIAEVLGGQPAVAGGSS